jgi:hypothetical protein
VDTGDADALGFTIALGNIYITILADWQIILRGLPVLWKARIIIVLTVKFGEFINLTIQGQACLNGKFQNPLVKGWQYPWKTKTYRAHMSVVLSAKGSSTATENLGISF